MDRNSVTALSTSNQGCRRRLSERVQIKGVTIYRHAIKVDSGVPPRPWASKTCHGLLVDLLDGQAIAEGGWLMPEEAGCAI
jgi:hypothetical protein